MAIHTDIGPTRARLRTMVRVPVAAFDSLGDQLAFHLRAIRWIPQTLVHYRKEVLRLIAEVTFGVGVLAVLGSLYLALAWGIAHRLRVREVGDLLAPVTRRLARR